MNYYQSNNLSFNGLKIDDRIVCENCGWSWKVKDGGDDLYVCHKCNYDNSKFYLPKDNKYSNADYSEAITQGISAVGSIGSSIAQKKANEEAGKTNIEREVEIKCGKDKSKSWIK
jgi:hypothetical protein